MAEQSVGELYITETVGGEDVKFRKLTVYDRRDILRRLKKRERESLLQDLREIQADKAESLGELRAFDERKEMPMAFIMHFDTEDGKTDVFDAALSEYPEAEQQRIKAKLSLSSRDTVELAAKLCNIQLDPITPGAPDPNPQSPAPNPAEPDTYQTQTTPATT